MLGALLCLDGHDKQESAGQKKPPAGHNLPEGA